MPKKKTFGGGPFFTSQIHETSWLMISKARGLVQLWSLKHLAGVVWVCVNIDLSLAHSSAIWSRYMYTINLRKSKWLLAILLCISAKDYLMSNQSRSCSWSKEVRKKWYSFIVPLMSSVNHKKHLKTRIRT